MLDFITWHADPELLSTSFVNIRWYGLMFAIGFLIGYRIEERIFRHEGAPERWLGTLLLWVIGGTIIGARLGHCFFYEWDVYSQNPIRILYIWEGGLASHGGTIGVIIGVLCFSRFTAHRSPLWTFDRLVIPIALVGALIRIGNLMNHEIYGHPTDLPWGFRFITNIQGWMHGADPVYSMPSHPTQIYESAWYIALFGLLMWMYWRRNEEERPGLIFGTFLTLLFAGRFMIEYLKNNQVEFEHNLQDLIGMNMGQLLSVPFILIGIFFIIRAMRRPRVDIDFPNAFPDEKKDSHSAKNTKK
ncbi:MAG: prolipoprotein diacylglyceryl transferase [Muribaculaceae bacterium]|nr:prolipoprotein diacylglyceryl transferase [Muribaculaceae bacterium]